MTSILHILKPVLKDEKASTDLQIYRKVATKNLHGKNKSTFTFKNKPNIYFLIFKFYNSKLANTFMFYMKLSNSFDNNVLKLF